MPTFQDNTKNGDRLPFHRKKPWRAVRKRNGRDYFLGYFATKEEAAEREREFDRTFRPLRRLACHG